MTLFKMFRQPYLDGDDGANLGGAAAAESSTENTNQQTETQQTQQAEQMFKLKYNHEEREIPYSQAVELAQKGMNYDKAVERARQESIQNNPILSYLEIKAKRMGVTVDQLIENDRKYEEQQEVERYAQKEQISYETAERLMKLEQREKERDEREQAEKKAREESNRKEEEQKDFDARKLAMGEEFYQEFPDYTTKEKLDTIPKEVWAEADKWLKSGGREGRRLADALTRYNFKQQMTQQQTQQANEANANSSTGSVRTSGQTGKFFTEEQVKSMPQEEVNKNYDAIMESMKRWK